MAPDPNDPEIAISRIRTAIWKLEAENNDKKMQIENLLEQLDRQNESIKAFYRMNKILFCFAFISSFSFLICLL